MMRQESGQLENDLKEVANDLRLSEKIRRDHQKQLRESMKHLARKGSTTKCFRTAWQKN